MAYIDAVKAAAEHYKLLSEEANIRVIEMTLPPGARDNEHSHHNETVYFINGGSARVHLPDGTSNDLDIPDGFVLHHEPWTHSVENVGDSTIRAVIFERMP